MADIGAVPQLRPIEDWIERMGSVQLPVLGRTLVQLAELRRNEDSIHPRDISQLILHDPFMALRVLRFLKDRKGTRALADITTVEHAIMMLGVSPFFRAFSGLRAVEADLRHDRQALAGLMDVISRARHAALHAREWAQVRHDIESDEVVIAALLHDMAEMLLWTFAPLEAAEIGARLARDPAQRSTEVQREVLGFGLNELQVALAAAWELPPLITSLMDDFRAERPRARNVLLAVRLARHAAHGWEDAALPDDLDDVRRLLGRPGLEVRQRVFQTAMEAVHDHEWYGDLAPAAWMPPFPLAVEQADSPGPRHSSLLLVRVKRMLAADEIGDLLNWAGSGALMRKDPSPSQAAVIALAMHGLFKGAGLARQMYCTMDEGRLLARTRFLGGVRDSARFSRMAFPLGKANPFTLKLLEEGTIWWRGVNDPMPFTDLPREWRIATGADGLFAGIIRLAEEGAALLYADAGAASGTLSEEKYAHFREICLLLGNRFAGPLPEA